MSRIEKKRLLRRARRIIRIAQPSHALQIAFAALARGTPLQERRYGEMLIAELLRRETMPAMMGMECVASGATQASDRRLRELLFAPVAGAR